MRCLRLAAVSRFALIAAKPLFALTGGAWAQSITTVAGDGFEDSWPATILGFKQSEDVLLVDTGACRYAITLDTVNPPVGVAAADVETLSFSPANLDPLTIYDWPVSANADPVSTQLSKASSEVRSFTAGGGWRGPAGFEGGSP